MDKTLIGYVMNALDEPELRQVEECLQNDADAAATIAHLRQSLAPLAADAEACEPPPGLVLKTLAHVAEHACSNLPKAPRVYAFAAEATPRRWLRRPDVLVAAGVLVLI